MNHSIRFTFRICLLFTNSIDPNTLSSKYNHYYKTSDAWLRASPTKYIKIDVTYQVKKLACEATLTKV